MKIFRYLTITFFLLVGASLLSACGGVGVASSWPGVTFDPDRELAYVAFQNHVYAVDVTNGNEVWRFPIEADNNQTFFASPTLTPDGHLIVGGFDNILYRVNAENGQPAAGESWPFQGATNRFVGSALATESGIYAPSADMRLYGLDLSGAERWNFLTGQPNWAAPAANGDTVYLTSMDHHVYAINAESGAQVWKSEPLAGAIVGSPVLSGNGVLYVGSFGAEVAALDVETGETRWVFRNSEANPLDWIWSGLALESDTLYAGDLSGNLYALNAETGEVRWHHQTEAGTQKWSITGQPLVIGDTVYYASENGSLYAVDAVSGNPRWQKEIGGQLLSTPVAAGDLILVAPVGVDQLLVAVDLEGIQRWAFVAEN